MMEWPASAIGEPMKTLVPDAWRQKGRPWSESHPPEPLGRRFQPPGFWWTFQGGDPGELNAPMKWLVIPA